MASRNMVRLHVLDDGDSFTLNGVSVRPFRVAEDYVYAFLLEDGDTRVLIAPDELVGWMPPDFVRGVDLAVMPMGVPEFDPFSGRARDPPGSSGVEVGSHLRPDPGHGTCIGCAARDLHAHRRGLPDEFRRLMSGWARSCAGEGYPIHVRYDTMTVEV